MASYRAGRARKKEQGLSGLAMNVGPEKPHQTLIIKNSDLSKLKRGPPESPIGLMSTTILEEDDTSEADFG